MGQFWSNAMIWNIVTCAVCLIMLILFRKLDRTNVKMAKLRRYSSRLFDDFKKLAETENRRFSDATIEMDILIKKSTAIAKNITASIHDLESKLRGLDIEKTNLSKVEEDIRVISQSARDVNRQIEFIAGAKESFAELSQNITYVKDTIKNLKEESNEMLQHFGSRIKEKTNTLAAEFSETMERMLGEFDQRLSDTGEILLQNFKMKIDGVAKSVEGASNLLSQIEMIRLSVADLESRIFAEIRDRSSSVEAEIKESINSLYDRLREVESEAADVKKGILDEFQNDIDRLYAKLAGVETTVNESKSKVIKTFESEVERVRNELDNLSIHAISKRDEIVQATRREAEEVKKTIEDFEERFSAFEQRLADTADVKAKNLSFAAQEAEKSIALLFDQIKANEAQIGGYIAAQMQKAKEDFSAMEERLASIKDEVINYEEQSRIFTRAEAMAREVNEAIESLNRMLLESRQEAQNLDKFFKDIEYLKECSKDFDREIRSFQAKKEKIADIEHAITTLSEMSELAIEKANRFQEQFSKIDAISGRIDALMDQYGTLESRIRELREYDDIISRNLESVSKTDILIQAIDGKLNSFQKTVERTDRRIDKINQHLREVEENTLILKTRENEIKEVRDKFNELDGLSAMMEARIKQIQAMFSKVEALREEINDTDNRLQDLFSQTDQKMRQFADFIQAVDAGVPIMKQVKGNATAVKNINENLIRTVRELSGKGWTSEEISRKLLMDENAVRLIINTTSL